MTHGNFRFLAGVALALLLGAASVSLLNTPAASAQSGVPQATTPTPIPTATPTATPTPIFSCGLKVTGGGQIPVPDPDSNIELSVGTGRATFGFNSQPKKGCTDGAAKGQFAYVNHITGLHINGKVTNSQLIAPNTVQLSGECGAGCTFTVMLQDNGEPDTSDTFGLTVTGTKNEVRSPRPISRGNIQFH